jgi:hypothetical protein
MRRPCADADAGDLGLAPTPNRKLVKYTTVREIF